jgi:hypothetical protein
MPVQIWEIFLIYERGGKNILNSKSVNSIRKCKKKFADKKYSNPNTAPLRGAWLG